MSYRFGTIPNIYSLDFPQFLILLDLFPMQKDAGCFGVEIPSIQLSKPFGYVKIRVQNIFPKYVGVVFLIHH